MAQSGGSKTPRGAFHFNPIDPEFSANPYASYPLMLQESPCVTTFLGSVLVSRYEQVRQVLLDTAHFSSQGFKLRLSEDWGPTRVPLIIFTDPPYHTKLRRFVMRDLTPRRIQQLEAAIVAVVEELLGTLTGCTGFDFMHDFADRIPLRIVVKMLGIQDESYQDFKQWSDEVMAVDALPPGAPPPAAAVEAAKKMAAFIDTEIEHRRRDPRDDIVSALLQAEEGQSLTTEEVKAIVIGLMLGGSETTSNLFGNGVNLLLRHPEQLARLRREPEMMPNAVEEILRFDPPIPALFRTSVQPVTLGGLEIAANTPVIVVMAAANRDPARFSSPDQFDINREFDNHLTFGGGPHVCPGSALSRVAAVIALQRIIERFPHMRLQDPTTPAPRKGSYFVRGMASLPVAVA